MTTKTELRAIERAIAVISSEVKGSPAYFQKAHPVLYRAIELIQIVLDIGPNLSNAVGRAHAEIVPEVMNNREHYQKYHPKIYESVQYLALTQTKISASRKSWHRADRVRRHNDNPVRGRRKQH